MVGRSNLSLGSNTKRQHYVTAIFVCQKIYMVSDEFICMWDGEGAVGLFFKREDK